MTTKRIKNHFEEVKLWLNLTLFMVMVVVIMFAPIFFIKHQYENKFYQLTGENIMFHHTDKTVKISDGIEASVRNTEEGNKYKIISNLKTNDILYVEKKGKNGFEFYFKNEILPDVFFEDLSN